MYFFPHPVPSHQDTARFLRGKSTLLVHHLLSLPLLTTSAFPRPSLSLVSTSRATNQIPHPGRTFEPDGPDHYVHLSLFLSASPCLSYLTSHTLHKTDIAHDPYTSLLSSAFLSHFPTVFEAESPRQRYLEYNWSSSLSADSCTCHSHTHHRQHHDRQRQSRPFRATTSTA